MAARRAPPNSAKTPPASPRPCRIKFPFRGNTLP